MAVTSSGNVGIGTINPRASLEINGTVQVDSTLAPLAPIILNNTAGFSGQALISQGAGLAPIWASGGGGATGATGPAAASGITPITTVFGAGATGWTVPAGVYSLTIYESGPGGGAGAVVSKNGEQHSAAGGGSGACNIFIATTTPGNVINFTIPGGGIGGSGDESSGAGASNTTIKIDGYTITANGGGGGAYSSSTDGVDGAGGTGGGCNSFPSFLTGPICSQGNPGEAAWSVTNAPHGSRTTGGSGGASPCFGGGGIGGNQSGGQAGGNGGGGGGGGFSSAGSGAGGNGGQGLIAITYITGSIAGATGATGPAGSTGAAGASGGVNVNPATLNYIPKITGVEPVTLGNSQLYDDGTSVHSAEPVTIDSANPLNFIATGIGGNDYSVAPDAFGSLNFRNLMKPTTGMYLDESGDINVSGDFFRGT